MIETQPLLARRTECEYRNDSLLLAQSESSDYQNKTNEQKNFSIKSSSTSERLSTLTLMQETKFLFAAKSEGEHRCK